jgi:hypothetical protein
MAIDFNPRKSRTPHRPRFDAHLDFVKQPKGK